MKIGANLFLYSGLLTILVSTAVASSRVDDSVGAPGKSAGRSSSVQLRGDEKLVIKSEVVENKSDAKVPFEELYKRIDRNTIKEELRKELLGDPEYVKVLKDNEKNPADRDVWRKMDMYEEILDERTAAVQDKVWKEYEEKWFNSTDVNHLGELMRSAEASNKISAEEAIKIFKLDTVNGRWNFRLSVNEDLPDLLGSGKMDGMLNDAFLDLRVGISRINYKTPHFYLGGDKDLRALPLEIGKLTDTKKFTANDSSIQFIPHEIVSMSSLEKLSLKGNKIETLPRGMGSMRNLQEIDLSGNNTLKTLPIDLSESESLKVINLTGTNLKSLPAAFNKPGLKLVGFTGTFVK